MTSQKDGLYTVKGSQAARNTMKVQASVKKRCIKCKIIKRKGVLFVVCETPKHKQRQG